MTIDTSGIKDEKKMTTIDKFQPGQTVWNTIRRKMGNTTISELAVFKIAIKEIDADKNRIFASWNSNAPKWFYRGDWSKWKLKEPKSK